MFGPLPQLHRLLVVITALMVGIASGAWIVQFTPISVAVAAGVAWGAAAGLLLAYVLVHDFHHGARPVRVRRH